MRFFDFSTSEKSSDYQSHETWKKAFTATSEPGPAISGGCSDSKKKSPNHIKALNTNTCTDYKTGQFLYVALGLPLILFWEEQALGDDWGSTCNLYGAVSNVNSHSFLI